MERTTELDIAWAAGLFEGEGSCFVSGGQRQACAALAMTDEDVVRRFAEIVGVGNVRFYPKTGRKDVWQWSAQSADSVQHVLGLLLPYLGQRRQARAEEVLARAAEIAANRDLCKRGHDLTDAEHLYTHAKTGKRGCRTCRRGWRPRLAA